MKKYKFMLDLGNAYINNIDKGVKHCEIAIQKVIEDTFNIAWWKICEINIFMELLQLQTDPVFLFDKILKDIEQHISIE